MEEVSSSLKIPRSYLLLVGGFKMALLRGQIKLDSVTNCKV